jgi:hypothetical protein
MPTIFDRFFQRPSPVLAVLAADFASGQLPAGRRGDSKSVDGGSGRPVAWSAIALNASPAEQEFVVYAICANVS